MRIGIVTESFLPSINGVTNSVLRILENLQASGDQAFVIAPSNPGMPTEYAGYAVKSSAAIPTHNFLPVSMPMGVPQKRLKYLIEGFNPDVLHLASPFALGSYAAKVAKQLKIPTVSIYQTELGGFAKQYGLGIAQNSLQKILYKIHSQTDRTLAPSKTACLDLHLAGVPNVFLWQRGVDTQLFNPGKKNQLWQDKLRADNSAKTIIGYVGRLALEKRVADLTALDQDPNIQLVIVGDGAHRSKLEAVLPNAYFVGFKSGEALARIYASLDLFVHPGPNETFCQAVQEALASGVPAIVPLTGGAADLVENNRTGYIIDTSDSEQLLQTVNKHITRTDKKQMRIAARASVSMRTWPRINSQLKEHYQQVIAENAKRKLDSKVVA
jgi:phosphatidylinositol alpha 1,6-mannosyltransferase